MKKKDNKGFSLVELIIVIAIMVVLVIAIAPQYLKFVHNSKIATDVQTAQAMVTDISTKIANTETVTLSDYTGLPSKCGGTWKITYDATTGVSKIELNWKAPDDTSAIDYEVFPNPDKASVGLNTKKKN